jgi:4-amino-4-deoxychorismate lyase
MLDLAKQLRVRGLLKGIEVRDVSIAEARASSEMLLMGSSVKVVSIVQWDDQVIGDGKPGPVGRALFQLLEDDMHSGDRLIDVPY